MLHWRNTLARLDLSRRPSDQDGLIVVIALHDLNLALACALRALVLGKGRLGADGRPDTALSLDVIAEVWWVEDELVRSWSGRTAILPHRPLAA